MPPAPALVAAPVATPAAAPAAEEKAEEKADIADGFAVLEGMDTFPYKNAELMPCLDLKACMRRCRERGFGAFVTWQGMAYFRRESAAQCERHLIDSAGSTTYLRCGTEEAGAGGAPAGATATKPTPALVTLTKDPMPAAIANVGPREPLTSLARDFMFNKHFVEKVQHLEACGYVGWRRVRGDGNCFYRAVAFGLLELLVATSVAQRFEWVTTLREKLGALQFDDAEEEAAHAELLKRVERLRGGGGWEAPAVCCTEATIQGFLCESMRSADGASGVLDLDLALIRAVRRLAARYITKHRHDASSGISFEEVCIAEGWDSAEQFNARVVLPLGVEAEGLVMRALPASMGISVRIAFLDRAARSGGEVAFCDYPSEDAGGADGGSGGAKSATPIVHVQLRPGHYDLLYFRQDAPTLPPKLPKLPALPNPWAGTAPQRGAADVSGPPTLSGSLEDAVLWWTKEPPRQLAPVPRENRSADADSAGVMQSCFGEGAAALVASATGSLACPPQHALPSHLCSYKGGWCL